MNVKTLQLYLGSVNFYQQNIPSFTNRLVPLILFLWKNVPFELTQHKNPVLKFVK